MKHVYPSIRRCFLVLLISGVSGGANLHAQLVINTAVTATTLVNSLIGQGMTVSNITLNCTQGAYGTFTNGNTTNMGITNGIMLTTGQCTNAMGPNNSPSAGTCNNTMFADPQLTAIEPQATNDPCILEFDVVPQCNNLQIRFVFGSEEYPEFVNSGFNDAFGFFVTGPGGPACTPNFYNNTNVATLPNNTTIVSIDNVNPNTNSMYYFDNTGGATIQYDGFTVVLTRNIALCPCSTYHWKLAIADAGDCIYDSGVFLDFLACSNAMTLAGNFTSAGCSGCNGTATVTVSGGQGPFTYNWSPAPGGGQGTATATGLCAGTYTCTVDDNLSCSPASTIAITVFGAASVTTTGTQTNLTCNGVCNGTANVTVNGGTGPYTYAWTPAPGGGQGTANATGLCAGTYTCAVTDNTGCTATQTFLITQPPAISVTLTPTAATCGNNNGAASSSVSGGAGGYSYLWSPGNMTTSNITNVAAGTYNLTVTDASGCSVTNSVSIGTTNAMTASNNVTNVLCNGGSTGSATVTIANGNGNVSYTWSPNVSNSSTANNLSAGTYVVNMVDGAGCTASTTVIITQPPLLTTGATSTAATCAPNGSVTANPTGGTPGYTYLWTPGNYTTQTVTNLPAGTYNVAVTDANGCTTGASTVVGNNTSLSSTSTQVDVDCSGNSTGSATINVANSSGNVTYSWTPNVSAAATASGLTAGTYVVDATDGTGCTTSQTITITEPTPLTLQSGGFNVTCFGACDGQIAVIPNGGTTPYNILWSTGCTTASCNTICSGNYNVTVTDGNGCTATNAVVVTEPPAISITTSTIDANCGMSDGSATANATGGTGTLTYQWNPSGSGQTISNLAPGTYGVTVTDGNGCTETTAVTINNLPGVVATVSNIVHVTCFGSADGSVSVNANGGTAPYTYSWSPAPASSSTTNAATGLPSGTYQVTVTDDIGCTSTIQATVTEPPQLVVNPVATPAVICFGQNVTLTANPSGGTPGYTVNWTPGGPGNSITITPQSSGSYSADVVDANGCPASAPVNVTVNPNPVASLSANTLAGCAPLCVTFADQSTVSSGNISQWTWDFGDGNNSSLANPVHCYLVPGTYNVTLGVTSAAGCSHSVTMTNYIEVFQNPVAGFTAGPQPATILDPEIFFTDTSASAVSWYWNFGDLNTPGASSTLQNPSYPYPAADCFEVTQIVTSVDGCTDTAVKEICIDPDVAIYVPTAFTPNDDGKNEIFMPVGTGIDPEHFEMWIFDRWGNLLFYTDDLQIGWDGKVQGQTIMCQVDTYVYKIVLIDDLGKKHSLIGHVSLIR
jgi:gliding motility-associated-like protein